MWSAIGRLLSEQLGSADIVEKTPLSGGDVHPAWHIRYGEHNVFMKCNQRDMLDLFTWEAAQLELLARSQTVRVPAVYGVGSDRDVSFLLLEYIPLTPLDSTSALELGQQLARLHQWSEQAHFGFDFDNNITTTPQPNSWLRRWSVFFAEQRIGWQLQLAAEKGIQYGNIDLIISCVQRAGHASASTFSAAWRSLANQLWRQRGRPMDLRSRLLLGRPGMRFGDALVVYRFATANL